LGEFNRMSSQSHVSHCRVLPLGEFTVTIPEPLATLQGAVMIPFSIEHTGIALTSDGVLKIGEIRRSVSC